MCQDLTFRDREHSCRNLWIIQENTFNKLGKNWILPAYPKLTLPMMVLNLILDERTRRDPTVVHWKDRGTLCRAVGSRQSTGSKALERLCRPVTGVSLETYKCSPGFFPLLLPGHLCFSLSLLLPLPLLLSPFLSWWPLTILTAWQAEIRK